MGRNGRQKAPLQSKKTVAVTSLLQKECNFSRHLFINGITEG
jgi:hypothetical protein